MPETVMRALTVRSAFTVTVPLPEAEVDTGGTSLPPDRLTLCVCAPPWMSSFMSDLRALSIITERSTASS